MDFSYFDKDGQAPDINDPNQIADEMAQLIAIAKNIGSYRWNYQEDFMKAPDNKEHIGIVAQQLLQVPGLEAAVSQDENGTLVVDTNYLALAAMGLVAALTRLVLDNNGVDYNGTANQELPAELPNSEATDSVSTETSSGAEPSGSGTSEIAEQNDIEGIQQPQAEPAQ